jgi:hypothetical protein
MKIAVLVHHRNYQEPASRSQEAYHPDPASPPGSAGSIAAPGMPSMRRLPPNNLNGRASVQSSAARHQAQRSPHHCSSRGPLALSEEDPCRASHRDTPQEACAPPTSQYTSHAANTESSEEELLLELKFPRRRLQEGYDVKVAVVARFGMPNLRFSPGT